MNTIKIWNDNPSDKQLKDIAAILHNGLTAIIPTDTMYALVCDATNMKAIERICKLKGINPEKQIFQSYVPISPWPLNTPV